MPLGDSITLSAAPTSADAAIVVAACADEVAAVGVRPGDLLLALGPVDAQAPTRHPP